MKILVSIVLLAFGVILLWVVLLLPRRNQPGWDKLAGFRYAHRGLHNQAKGVAENSLSAFRAAVEHGYGAELDVHLMSDGSLAVVHDSDLSRVCGKSAVIEKLTAADLQAYPLLGTEGETIPLLGEVLKLFEGKTPLVIELKAEGGNAAALTDAVMALLRGWNGTYCMESFHPAVLLRLRHQYSQVIRGQLSEDFVHRGEAKTLTLPVRMILTHLLTTVFTRPDFIAYRYQDRRCPSLKLMRRVYGVHEVGWTVRDRETMEQLEQESVTVIFEGFVP